MDGQQEQYTWERLPGENSRWYGRFLLFRDMGTSRTMLGAVRLAPSSQKKPVKMVPGSWKDAAEKWHWKDRVDAWDAHIQRLNEAEIQKILTEGYAAIHERVKALGWMAKEIEESFKHPDSGKMVYQWLTPDKVREWRGCLADIAEEQGHRVKTTKQEHSGALEIITGARDALLGDLAELPDASQSQKQDSSAGADTI